MKKTLYAKYNRIRKPEFQICTKIILEKDVQYVEKKAITNDAQQHINSFLWKYDRLSSVYSTIKPLRCTIQGNSIRLPFIEGYSGKELLEGSKSNIKKLCDKIDELLVDVFSYKEDIVVDFYNTDGFRMVFGQDLSFPCKAVVGADIDIMFDNVLYLDEDWYSFDYEWTFDFPIPIEFIKFRILYRYYISEVSYFDGKMSQLEFLKCFDYDEEKVKLYTSLEQGFLYYVFGKNCQYSYTDRYLKQRKGFLDVVNEAKLTKEELRIRDDELKKAMVQNAELSKELEKMRVLLDTLEKNYNCIINSLSWKMTSPVRKLLNMFKQ